MSKVQTSQNFWDNQKVSLFKRQSGGSVSKSECERLKIKSFGTHYKDGQQVINGYEIVYDNIVERKVLYCLVCGYKTNGRKCDCCNNENFFFTEKFNGICATCERPFYVYGHKNGKLTNRITFDKFLSVRNYSKDELIRIAENRHKIDKCDCFQNLRQKLAEHKNNLRIVNHNAKIKKQLASKSEKLTAYKLELDNIVKILELCKWLSRRQKNELKERKLFLLMQLNPR